MKTLPITVLLAAVLAGCAAGPAPSGGSMPAVRTAPQPAGVEVTWLGQAAFRIVSPGGKVIVIDP